MSSPSPQSAPLFLTCFHLCRDGETLGQRVAKRSSASTGGQSPAGTSSTPLVVESNPDNSPRRSPPRAFTTHSPSMCVGVRSPGADLAVVAGGGRQQEEPLRATPNTPPLPTTPPRGATRQGRRAPSLCTRRRRRRTWALVAPSRHRILVGRGPLLSILAWVGYLPSVSVRSFSLIRLCLIPFLASRRSPSRPGGHRYCHRGGRQGRCYLLSTALVFP